MTDTATYDAIRHFADSWGLLVMLLMFVVLIAWPFRPGAGASNDRSANMIFDEDETNG